MRVLGSDAPNANDASQSQDAPQVAESSGQGGNWGRGRL